MQKTRFLKVKNSLIELEKDSLELKDTELKEREIKIKGEIEELFVTQITVSIDDIDKFKQKKSEQEKTY